MTMLYRALRPLSKGQTIIQSGDVFSEDFMKPESIDVLLRMKRIAPVQAPPLQVFPGWGARARRLKKIEITTVEQFMDAKDEAIAEALKLKDPGEVAVLRGELLGFLKFPKPRGG